jgi:hypothetical protein
MSTKNTGDGLPQFPIADDDEQENDLPGGDSQDLSNVESGLPDLSGVESGITSAATSLDRATEKLAQSSTLELDALDELTAAVLANTSAIQSMSPADGATAAGSVADRPDTNAFNSMLSDDGVSYTPPGPGESKLDIETPAGKAPEAKAGPSLFDKRQEQVHQRLALPSPNQDLTPRPTPHQSPRRSGSNVVATGDRVWRGLEAARYATSSISSNLPSGSLGPSMLPSVAGGAINGAMAGASIGGAPGAAIGAAAGAAVSGINAMGAAARSAAENLGQYDSRMSAANAEANIRQVKGDINRAQVVSPETARYTEVTSKLSQGSQDLQAAVLQAALKQALPLLETIVDLIENHGAAATELLSTMLDMIVKIIDGLAEWRIVDPMIAAIARGMADTARNLREINDRAKNDQGVEVDKFMADFLRGRGLEEDPAQLGAAIGAGGGLGAAVGGMFPNPALGAGGLIGGLGAFNRGI